MGGGGSGNMQSTTVTSNIPDYARPYVENMLGAAQQQVFKPDAQGNYTGFNAYVPYSTDPTKYFAPFSDAQKQAYGQAMGLSSPGQFSTATGLAGLAGQGQLGLTQNAGVYGQAAANASQAGFNAGTNYQNTVTNPDEFSKYMSPYTQQIITPQLNQAQRDYEIANNQANLAAARQGTYGGSRNDLQQIEREKALNMQKSNIIGQGLSNAYDRALNSIQFGSNLGLQGLQAGYQGIGMGLQGIGTQQQGLAGAANSAAILGQLGSQQQGTDLARVQALGSLGAAQQQYQQGIIDQAVQNYATAQQYPYMQLGEMSSLLRGLPTQNMTTQQYMAQPSLVQQGAGLLGAYGAYKGAFKEGGLVKRYDVGGSVEHDLDQIKDADPSNKEMMSLAGQTQSPTLKRMIAAKMMQTPPVMMAEGGDPTKMDRAYLMNELDKIERQQPQNQVQAQTTEPTTASSAPSTIVTPKATPTIKNKVDNMGSAYKSKSSVKATPIPTTPTPQNQASNQTPVIPIGNDLQSRIENLGQAYKSQGMTVPGQAGPAQQKLIDMISAQQANAGKSSEENDRLHKALAFLEFGSTPFGPLRGALEGGKSYLASKMQDKAYQNQLAMQQAQMLAGIEAQREAGGQRMIGSAQEEMSREHALNAQLQNARDIAAGNNAAMINAAGIRASAIYNRPGPAPRETDFTRKLEIEHANLLAKGYPDDANTRSMAMRNVQEIQNQIGQSRIDANQFAYASRQHDALMQKRSLVSSMGADTSDIDAQLGMYNTIMNRYLQQNNQQRPTPDVSNMGSYGGLPGAYNPGVVFGNTQPALPSTPFAPQMQ